MVLQAGANLQRGEIIDYVHGVVQVAVQLRRSNGRRIVSEVSLTLSEPVTRDGY